MAKILEKCRWYQRPEVRLACSAIALLSVTGCVHVSTGSWDVNHIPHYALECLLELTKKLADAFFVAAVIMSIEANRSYK